VPRFSLMRNPFPPPPRRGGRSPAGSIGAWLLGVTVVILAVVFAGYWFFLRSDSKAKPKIENTKVTAGGSLNGTWKVTANDAAGSFVGYRVHERFAQGLVDNEATGRTSDVTASMSVDGSTVSDVSVTANLATLRSDKDFRDERLHRQGLETDTFPTATFVASGPVTLPDPPAKGRTVAVSVDGDLTLHGVTKQVSVPLKGRWDGRTIQVVGELPVRMSDYGMTAPTSPVIAEVDDHGSLELQLFFVQ
jgi:polyisoprenoid-binding protein YceI